MYRFGTWKWTLTINHCENVTASGSGFLKGILELIWLNAACYSLKIPRIGWCRVLFLDSCHDHKNRARKHTLKLSHIHAHGYLLTVQGWCNQSRMLKAKLNTPKPNPHILPSMNVLVRGSFELRTCQATGPGDATCGLLAKLMAEKERRKVDG